MNNDKGRKDKQQGPQTHSEGQQAKQDNNKIATLMGLVVSIQFVSRLA